MAFYFKFEIQYLIYLFLFYTFCQSLPVDHKEIILKDLKIDGTINSTKEKTNINVHTINTDDVKLNIDDKKVYPTMEESQIKNKSVPLKPDTPLTLNIPLLEKNPLNFLTSNNGSTLTTKSLTTTKALVTQPSSVIDAQHNKTNASVADDKNQNAPESIINETNTDKDSKLVPGVPVNQAATDTGNSGLLQNSSLNKNSLNSSGVTPVSTSTTQKLKISNAVEEAQEDQHRNEDKELLQSQLNQNVASAEDVDYPIDNLEKGIANSKMPVFTNKGDVIYDDANSHFFAYFLTMIVMAVLFYLLFHNKQRIIALMIEGRGARSSRRSSRAKYHKLDNNLEETMSSTRGLGGNLDE